MPQAVTHSIMHVVQLEPTRSNRDAPRIEVEQDLAALRGLSAQPIAVVVSDLSRLGGPAAALSGQCVG